MHILHITPYYAPAYTFGGVPRAVEGLARAQVADGHRVTVLTTDAGVGGALLAGESSHQGGGVMRDGVIVYRARNLAPGLRARLNLSTPIGFARLLHAILARSLVDAAHLHEFRTIEALIAVPILVRRGVPIALSPHGTLTLATGRGAMKAGWDRLFSRRLARRLHAVIGLTDDEIAEARAAWRMWRVPEPAFAVVPNGVDESAFSIISRSNREAVTKGILHTDPDDAKEGAANRARSTAEASAFRARYAIAPGSDGEAVTEGIVLFLGRLHARKGVEPLLRAFLTLNTPDARLVFAGGDEGMRSTLETIAAGDPRIVFTGFIDGTDRRGALAAAAVFALPATGEGLSIAALEAMAAGVPLVLSPGCHLPEAEAAGAAIIVQPTPDAIARALRQLLSDPARRAAMGAAGRALARDRFTWRSAAAGAVAVYKSLNVKR